MRLRCPPGQRTGQPALTPAGDEHAETRAGQDQGLGIEIVATIVAGLLLAVAAIGTVYPVLSGSLLAIVTLIGWAWIIGSPGAWAVGVIGSIIAAVGWSASAVLTRRKLRQLQIPRRSILVAVVSGVVGMFLIPVVGLFVGFGAGLLASEYARRRDLRSSLRSSVETLKATGLGVLVEFGMVCLAASVWMIGVIAHFTTR
jgi:uncharacterized protein YqgC (DUF456 family)